VPDHPLALHYLGVVLYQRGAHDDALPLLDRAVALVPGEPEFHNNRGLALTAADRLDEAVDAFHRALALRPAHAGTWNNLGLAEVARNALDQADAAYTRALALEPGFDFARWNHALALLAAGRYRDGWRAYDARLSIAQFRPPEMPPQPRWDGDTRPGLRLLVLAEQGLGDTLQFIRYARTLAEREVVVTAAVPDKLRALVATVPGVAAVSGHAAPWPAVDAWIPLLSLPGLLDVTPTAPAIAAPYLAVDAARRQAATRAVHAVASGRTTMGLAWAGARHNTNDRRRSMPLARLAPLLVRSDVACFSLQHDDDAEVASTPAARSLHRLPARIAYDDMAALVDVLDLVVTVDTSLAHLAGALDRPAWILLPFAADWRWGVAGDRTPWYASARLFRQPRAGDWDSVVDAVGRALDERRAAAA
jgi:tetratricopeptide (TPR) repeat protein